MNLEWKSVPFELKASDDGTFEGLAACFHNIDAYGDIIQPGAFLDTLPEFLASGFVGGLGHNWQEPIGRPLEARETAQGLQAKAKVSDTSAGRDALTLMKDGVVKKLSIGFRTLGRTWLESADEVMAYWQSQGYAPSADDVAASQYGARLLTKVRLYEFSPVAVPANPLCSIDRVKGDGEPVRRTFRDHSLRVLADVEEFAERAASLAAMRAEKGKDLPPDQKAALKRLRDHLDSLLVEPAAKSADAAQLYTQYLLTCARSQGVAL